MIGVTSLINLKGPITFVSIKSFTTSIGISIKGEQVLIPALFTRLYRRSLLDYTFRRLVYITFYTHISILPLRAKAVSIADCQVSSFDTSP